MATYAPRMISRKILELCNDIIPGVSPTWVPVRTMKRATPNDCFPNVKAKISLSGGEIQYGWSIWEWVDVLIEAEFHAVWRSPEGRLICVSPHQYDDKILFLPDNSLSFNGVDRVDNIRKSLRKDPIVNEFIATCKGIYAEKERLTKGCFGMVKMDITPESRELAKRHQAQLAAIKALPPVPKLKQECPCGSGKLYEGCCGAE